MLVSETRRQEIRASLEDRKPDFSRMVLLPTLLSILVFGAFYILKVTTGFEITTLLGMGWSNESFSWLGLASALFLGLFIGLIAAYLNYWPTKRAYENQQKI